MKIITNEQKIKITPKISNNMAFEDRCSPNQANSPGPVSNGVPSSGPESPSSPNPNERNLKPYTCTTVPKYEKSKSPSSRMSPNLAYVKPQPVSPVETTPTNGVHPSIMYNPYYNPYLLNAIPMHPDYLRLYQHNPMLPPVDMKPLFLRQEALLRGPPRGDNNGHDQGNEVTDEDQERLHFSISNILKPEFGLNAIKKTTNKKEGPKPGGPVHSILYKPYDLTKSSLEAKALDNAASQLASRSPLENNKSLLERRSEYIQSRTNLSESPFKSAPLGNLCNTVSQIGTNKPFPPKNLSSFSNSQNGLKTEGNKSLSSFQPSRDDYRRPDSANSSISTSSSNVSSQQGQTNGSEDGQSTKSSSADTSGNSQWPAWVFCTRYSDRPSSGPRSRRTKKKKSPSAPSGPIPEDKRPRTAFSSAQLARLKHEFAENRYLNERRRQQLSSELGLNEAQIKIWFQNKRAKIKKSSGQKNPLALQLMAQGLYNHGTASCSEGEDDDISVA